MKILIVGAGIGGLALSAFCQKSGIEYEIIEKQKDQSHHGYTLGMWANGRRMLVELGLGDLFDRHAVPMKFFSMYTGSGRLIRSYNLSEFHRKFGMGYFHIQRQDLICWLSGLLPKDKVTFGVSVSSIEQNTSGVSVLFSNNQKGSYDLVVASDGVSSMIRQAYVQKDSRKYSNWRVWYMWVPAKYVKAHSVSAYCEAGQYINIFNEGKDQALAVLIAHEDHTIWDTEEGRIATLKGLFNKEISVMPAMLDGKKAVEIMPTDLSEVENIKMYAGRIALLGDAAHGFEPFGGLGGSMALEDAYILAGELLKNSSIDAALSMYETKRVARIKEALQITQRMRILYQTRSRFLRALLNIGFRFVNHKLFTKNYIRFLNKEI